MTNPGQELVLRQGPQLWVAIILLAGLFADSVNPVVGGTVVIIGVVPALNRPRVTPRTDRPGAPRTRSMQAFVASTHTWHKVPALVTSLVLPGAASF